MSILIVVQEVLNWGYCREGLVTTPLMPMQRLILRVLSELLEEKAVRDEKLAIKKKVWNDALPMYGVESTNTPNTGNRKGASPETYEKVE